MYFFFSRSYQKVSLLFCLLSVLSLSLSHVSFILLMSDFTHQWPRRWKLSWRDPRSVRQSQHCLSNRRPSYGPWEGGAAATAILQEEEPKYTTFHWERNSSLVLLSDTWFTPVPCFKLFVYLTISNSNSKGLFQIVCVVLLAACEFMKT